MCYKTKSVMLIREVYFVQPLLTILRKRTRTLLRSVSARCSQHTQSGWDLLSISLSSTTKFSILQTKRVISQSRFVGPLFTVIFFFFCFCTLDEERGKQQNRKRKQQPLLVRQMTTGLILPSLLKK